MPLRSLLFAFVAALAACRAEPPPEPLPPPVPPAPDVARPPQVLDAYVPAAPAGGTGALFATITGGSVPDTLVLASTAQAARAEIHESVAAADGMRGMRAMAALPVAAADTVALAPGGYHVMLMGLQQALAPGDTVRVDLRFARGGTVAVEAIVRDLGDLPAHGAH